MADAGVRQVVVTQPVIRAIGNSLFLNITVVLETRDVTKKEVYVSINFSGLNC